MNTKGIFSFLKSAISRKPAVNTLSGITKTQLSKQTGILNFKSISELKTDTIMVRTPVPEYLYHLTSPINYDNMLKQGFIRTSQTPKGIYCIEVNNFLNEWTKLKINNGSRTIQDELIKYLQKNSDEIVVLQIPTANLRNSSNIKIRSQNLLYQREIDPRNNPTLMKHLLEGDNVSLADSYISKGDAIEYIIPDAVPVGEVKLVGKFNLRSNNINEIFSDILQNGKTG